MEKEKKVTKLEILNAIAEYALNNFGGEQVLSGRVTASDVINFAQTQAEQLQKKASREKAKAEEKKAKVDELLLLVQDKLVKDEFQSAQTILEQIEFPEVTKAKVTNRLSKLVSLGVAEKDVQKEDKKQVTVYKLIG